MTKKSKDKKKSLTKKQQMYIAGGVLVVIGIAIYYFMFYKKSSEPSITDNIQTAEVVAEQLSALNPETRVDVVTSDEPPSLSDYTLVVITDESLQVQQNINKIARECNTKFIGCQTRGLFCQLFVDF